MVDDQISLYVAWFIYLCVISFCLFPIYYSKTTPILTSSTAPILGVIKLWAATIISSRDVLNGILGAPGATIKPFSVILLILSQAYSILSIDQTGLLEFVAYKTVIRAGSSGITLFFYIFLLTSLTSNDAVALTLTPILCYISDQTGKDVKPYLLSFFMVSNIASATL
jgi:Na+/H+ antiporter NhaD/arsenite permease-like protein